MTDGDEEREQWRLFRDAEVQFLIGKTGISEAQACDLVMLLGLNRASLLREAHLLMKKKD